MAAFAIVRHDPGRVCRYQDSFCRQPWYRHGENHRAVKALTVERAKAPGLYPDGGGLRLQIKSREAKSWVFRFKHKAIAGGKARMMGLGSTQDYCLAAAWAKAAECRRLIAEGKEPYCRA